MDQLKLNAKKKREKRNPNVIPLHRRRAKKSAPAKVNGKRDMTRRADKVGAETVQMWLNTETKCTHKHKTKRPNERERKRKKKRTCNKFRGLYKWIEFPCFPWIAWFCRTKTFPNIERERERAKKSIIAFATSRRIKLYSGNNEVLSTHIFKPWANFSKLQRHCFERCHRIPIHFKMKNNKAEAATLSTHRRGDGKKGNEHG